MLLTFEELEIIAKAIPILGKILAASTSAEPEMLYGMGTPNADHSWGMWDGPTHDLEHLLKYPPPDTHVGPFYIIQLFQDKEDIRLYRWNKEEYKWKKLKQK